MKTANRVELVRTFKSLAPILPTAEGYIKHLEAIEGSELRVAEIFYTLFLQCPEDLAKELA